MREVFVGSTKVKSARLEAFRQKHLFDYTSRAEIFWFAVVICGFGLLANSFFQVATSHIGTNDMVLIGCWFVCSWLTTRLTVRTSDKRQVAITLGDVFMYVAFLMHGPFVASICAAIEGYSGAHKTSKRLSSHLFSTALSCSTVIIASHTFKITLAYESIEHLFKHLLLFGTLHWTLQTFSVFVLVRLKKATNIGAGEWLRASSQAGMIQTVAVLFAGTVFVLLKVLDSKFILVLGMFGAISLALVYINLQNSAEDDQDRDRLQKENDELKSHQ
jgi:hypothetical protein